MKLITITGIAALCTASFVCNPLLAAEGDYPDEFYEPVDDLTPPAEQPPVQDQPPMLGIQMTPPPTHAQETNGTTPDEGVYVRRVFPNTAAEDMGVQPGDIILSVNGTEIDSMSTLRDVVNNSSVGDEVDVTVVRNGETHGLNSSFRPWLDDVKRTNLDRKAEERYRDMQKRRLERRMNHHNNRSAMLDREINARQDPGPLNWDNDQSVAEHLQKELGLLPDMQLPAIDLSGLPFSFQFAVDVDSNTLEAMANDGDKPLTVAEPLQMLSSFAPHIDLDFNVDVDTNEY